MVGSLFSGSLVFGLRGVFLNTVCAWMALNACLKTKAFLKHRNILCDTCCALCESTWEDLQHLLLFCPFTKKVWINLLDKVSLQPLKRKIK